jgi:uncharacterized protein YndB with AHSA1/START domain
MNYPINPKLDLFIEKVVDIKPELIWKAWTDPEILKQWFCPAPWKTIDAEIDLRPGGIFRSTMQSPEGQEFPNAGCYLEVIENKKLVWTSALSPGFRPAAVAINGASMFITAIILLEAHCDGTKYTAIALHKDEADRQQHEAMGFEQGWSKCLEQLVDVMKKN